MRLIISAVTASLLAVAVLGFGTLAERNARQTLGEVIEGRLILEARNLASLSVDALLTDFPELTLCPLVSEIQQDREDLALVAVLDHDGHVQGHLDLTALGQELTELEGLQPRPATHELRAGERVLAGDDLVLVAAPARHASGREVGTAVVGLHQSYLDEMVARPRQAFLALTAGLLVAGIAVTLIIMSMLLRPMSAVRAGLERIGRGELSSPIGLHDRTEMGLLAETVDGMAGQLLRSQKEMLEKERLGAEMSLAHQMQHALLPEGEVRSGPYVCKGTYQAAAEVGGDYYDIFELRDGKLGLVIADVSGKGLAGCLVTSMLAVLIRSLRDQHASPRELLIDLEKGLLTTLARGTFVTVFYGILDPGSGRLVFASAAHSPLAVYRADRRKVEWFFTKGIPLGAMRSGVMAGTLQDQEVILAPGDVALQFTDGLNEAWNPREKRFFGFEGIAAHLQASGRRGGHAVQAELLPLVEAWTHPDPLGDDFTLLTVERTASPVATGPKHGDPLAFQTDTGQGRARLEEMLSGTLHLQLPSQMDALIRLREWVNTCLDGHRSLTEHKKLIEGSLFEVCANIIEHGYGNEPDQDIDLWWVPLPGGLQNWSSFEGSAHADEESAEAHRDGVGYFVICDQGSPFDPTSWTPPDLDDPAIRRRGRGLGWQIIYSSMKKVVYESHTPAGNLTLLRFDPAMHAVR